MSAGGPGQSGFDDGKEARALRTIGEVAAALGIKQHVLRYWEQQFPMLRPLKRSGGLVILKGNLAPEVRPYAIEALRTIHPDLVLVGPVHGIDDDLRSVQDQVAGNTVDAQVEQAPPTPNCPSCAERPTSGDEYHWR